LTNSVPVAHSPFNIRYLGAGQNKFVGKMNLGS
jgi:hypothetical protein